MVGKLSVSTNNIHRLNRGDELQQNATVYDCTNRVKNNVSRLCRNKSKILWIPLFHFVVAPEMQQLHSLKTMPFSQYIFHSSAATKGGVAGDVAQHAIAITDLGPFWTPCTLYTGWPKTFWQQTVHYMILWNALYSTDFTAGQLGFQLCLTSSSGRTLSCHRGLQYRTW